MNQPLTVLAGALGLALAYCAWWFFRQASDLKRRYSGIVDVDAELAAIKKRLEAAHRDQDRFVAEQEDRRTRLSNEYEQALVTYRSLSNEVSLLEENLDDISFGLYKPHFNFQSSEEYKAALLDLLPPPVRVEDAPVLLVQRVDVGGLECRRLE